MLNVTIARLSLMIPLATHRHTLLAVMLAFAVTAAAMPPARAQDANGSKAGESDAAAKARGELETVRQDLEESRTRAKALEAEAEALGRDRKALADQLVETAGRIRAAEDGLARTEQRLVALTARQETVSYTLEQRRAELAVLLAAGERMGRNPPPAVVVRPEDALTAVRSAMLLGAMMPELRGRMERVADDLAEIERLRREGLAERSRIAAETEILQNERTRLDRLVALRQQSEQEARAKLADAEALIKRLGKRAESLKDLIESVEKAAASARTAMPDEKQLAALTDPGKLGARIAFDKSFGRLPYPVSGAVLTEFGTPDNFGGDTRGISLAGRRGETVISPCDAWVVYSGPFRTYGHLLILNAGGGYHIVLAGLDRISVELGQFVLTGEPIGTMGGAATRAATNVTASNASDSVLYVEFRKDGAAIDPSPWWAKSRQEVQG